MKPLWYYILLALAAADRHGQAIAREISHLSGGQVRPWPATLYGALDELGQHGWIDELSNKRRPADESLRRRFYQLTPAGRAALAVETDRLAAIVNLARRRVRAGAESR